MNEMKPIKVTIVSDLLRFGPAPEPGDEIAQRITINNKGQVWFRALTCSNSLPWKAIPLRKAQTKVSVDLATDILSRIDTYFRDNSIRCFATDVGNWEMELTLEDGSIFKESGSMYCCPELIEISDVLRYALPEMGIVAFGEDYPEDDDQDE